MTLFTSEEYPLARARFASVDLWACVCVFLYILTFHKGFPNLSVYLNINYFIGNADLYKIFQ